VQIECGRRQIMSVMDTMKTITDLAKKGMTVGLQEKIMQLREEVIALKEENMRLRSENATLKLTVDRSYTGEQCPKCKKGNWEFVSSRPHPIFGPLGSLERTYKCSACGFSETHIFDPDKD